MSTANENIIKKLKYYKRASLRANGEINRLKNEIAELEGLLDQSKKLNAGLEKDWFKLGVCVGGIVCIVLYFILK